MAYFMGRFVKEFSSYKIGQISSRFNLTMHPAPPERVLGNWRKEHR